MKGKLWLVLIALALFSSIVIADDYQLIFNGMAQYGVNFTGGGYVFSLSGQSDLSNFVVNLPDSNEIFISEAGCFAKGDFLVCYNGTKVFNWVNYTLDKEYWNASINISKLWEKSEGLEIKKELVYDEPALVQEPISVTIKLKNNASVAIKGIVLKDSVPEQFKVKNAFGCEFFGVNIRWYGTLNPKETHLCKYTIAAMNNVSYTTPATVEYLQENLEKTAVSNEINLTIGIPTLRAETYVLNNTVKVGDMLFYSINLTNTDEEESIYVNNLEIHIPKNIMILQYYPRFKEKKFGFSFKQIIEENESVHLWFLGKALEVGNISIFSPIEYTIRQVPTKTEMSENITIIVNDENLTNVTVDNQVNETVEEPMDTSEISNLSEIDNISGAGNNSAVENVSQTPTTITHPLEEKKPISLLIVFGVCVAGAIGFGVFKIIKKKRESFY